jgi:hypothetical protein
MRGTRMVRLLSEHPLEDFGGFLLVSVRLVRGQRRCVEGESVEHPCLPVIGVAHVDLLHRLLIGDTTRPVVELVAVAIEACDRLDVVALAVRLCADGLCLGDGVGSCFECGFAGRIPERVPITHCHAPVSHGAGGIRFRYDREGLHSLLIPERVK